MIHFKPTDKAHVITVKSPIGDFFEGQEAIVRMMPMTGRIYKHGKDAQGKFLDLEGQPDKRLMVFDSSHYCVGTKEELDKCFDEPTPVI